MDRARSLASRMRHQYHTRQREKQCAALVRQVRPYSMVPDSGLRFVIEAVRRVLDQGVAGDFVECGVWQGGSAAAMLLAQRAFHPEQPRPIHLFDSFEGLPPAQEIDGRRALAWQANADDPVYYDNCAVSLEQVQGNFRGLGLLGPGVHFYPGWFETTIPSFVRERPDLKIAVLRLDGDWYESTKVCIEHLYDRVAENGIVIIDDYYAWEGCTLAIHEFLGARRLSHPIRGLPDLSSAYFVKQGA